MSKKEHRVSKRYAKRQFNTVGLLLIMYALAVLIVPYFLHMYMISPDSIIMKDDMLYYGLYVIIILFHILEIMIHNFKANIPIIIK